MGSSLEEFKDAAFRSLHQATDAAGDQPDISLFILFELAGFGVDEWGLRTRDPEENNPILLRNFRDTRRQLEPVEELLRAIQQLVPRFFTSTRQQLQPVSYAIRTAITAIFAGPTDTKDRCIKRPAVARDSVSTI